MFDKKAMLWLLDSAKEIPPICIPSYKRWERKDNKTLTRVIEPAGKEICSNTYVFVRKEQAALYRENYPDVNIVVLPDVNGLASTRQYICDFVLDDLRKDYFMDVDDDITGLKAVCFDGKTALTKAGEVSPASIIKLGYEIAKVAFEYSGCLLGNLRRVRFANDFTNSQTAYVTNKGATPRQVMYMNAKGLRQKGIRRNMEFDPTGDDVGLVAEIGKAHGDMFNIPCLAYAFVDDAINSVIRNDDNRKALAAYEYECLKKYPFSHYMRIPFTFEDGSYRFSDIDFTKYREAAGKSTIAFSLERFAALKKGGAN